MNQSVDKQKKRNAIKPQTNTNLPHPVSHSLPVNYGIQLLYIIHKHTVDRSSPLQPDAHILSNNINEMCTVIQDRGSTFHETEKNVGNQVQKVFFMRGKHKLVLHRATTVQY